MNLRMEPARTQALPPRGEAAPSRKVAVIVQDRTIHRQVLDILSGRYDLMVLRRFRDLGKVPVQQPGLILADSTALLTQDRAESALRSPSSAPVLALVEETHLETAGPLLAERVQDFLVRPFTATELLLRVSRIVRRFGSPPPGEFTAGEFRIDLRSREVYQGDRALPLTRKEVALLYALARRMGATATRDELLNEVWGAECDSISNVLDVHIRSLRRKIEPVPQQPRYIVTVRGIGYRFNGAAGATHHP